MFKPRLEPLSSDDQIRLDNKRYERVEGHKRKVTGWRMVGSSYRQGRRLPGFTHVLLEGGGYRYFNEDVAIGPALDLMATLGYDVQEAKEKLESWVKTGRLL